MQRFDASSDETGRGRTHGFASVAAFRVALILAAVCLAFLRSPDLASGEVGVSTARELGSESALRHRRLLEQAEADFSRGAFRDGLEAANEAFVLASAAEDVLRIASARMVRANLLLALGDPSAAAADLERTIAAASELALPELADSAGLNLANARVAQGRPAEAEKLYQLVADSAAARGVMATAIRARVNRLRVQVEAAARRLEAEESRRIRVSLDRLPASPDKAMLLVHLAGTHLRALEADLGDRRSDLEAASQLLREALALADATEDPEAATRIRAQALGQLGAVYEQEGRLAEAMTLTRRALLQATRSETRADLFLWHRQSARLHRALGQTAAAIDDYAAAIRVLEAHRGAITRTQLLSIVPGRQAAELSQLYRSYVDLLLGRAREAESKSARRADLLLAQATLEQLKSDELRDYFDDDCVIKYREKLTSVSSTSYDAMIVYPFLLAERLELLVSAGDELYQVVVDVDRATLTEEVDRLRQLLEKRTTRQYLRPAKRLYDWLIAPIDDLLEVTAPETLVFVPDGVLRTIPMAALYDGERYLIERVALGLTPGLELTDPKPFGDSTRKALVAGVSEAVQGFAPLPNVEREVDSVHEIIGGDRLLNRGFSREALTERIREESFGLIHIASHARFDPTASGGYMLAHDGRLSFDALAEAVESARFRDAPLELVILSACETAEGDARAALGLSGVAIKAGARSALGTLWRVSDEATSEFMVRFYRRLRESGTSRAQAVRSAQLRLLEDRRYRHPYYWSPFLLINSWL